MWVGGAPPTHTKVYTYSIFPLLQASFSSVACLKQELYLCNYFSHLLFAIFYNVLGGNIP